MKNEKGANLAELLANIPPPQWVVDMRRHYQETGRYRAEDVRRVIGDAARPSELQRQMERAATNQALRRWRVDP